MNILITDNIHPVLITKFKDAGFKYNYLPTLNQDEISNIIDKYEGLIIRSKTSIDSTLLKKARKLKFIGRLGSGMENIDLNYAHKINIKCFNSPEGNRDAVGEHAIGMLLALFNKLCKSNIEVKNMNWLREANRGTEIKGKTIGIIGYGNTGSAFAKKLSGFETNVIAHDKYKFNFSDNYVKECSLDILFNETDILSLHIPLTEETKFIINNKFINKFKKNIYLINTARGKVVNTNDLVLNLKSGKILGAALDVLEFEETSFEKLNIDSFTDSFEYLKENDNIILSPHIAGWTNESYYKLSEILANKIIAEFK